ncbi:MAG: FHA domain-containing protein [Roseiflexaceae bacterium]|nr:FHA domain-containing protein [Roseiflexaceae bacterium]
MMEFANISLNVIILLLRVAVVLLLYYFLYQVLRAVVRELRSAAQNPVAAGGQSPYGQLVVVRAGQSGVAAGKAFPLGPSNIIGRSMENCEIALNDSFLSAQHARLEMRGDEWFLEDLHSTNGTFLNEMEVRDAATVEQGDIVRVGRVEMKLT